MQGYYKTGNADDITVFKDFTAKTLREHMLGHVPHRTCPRLWENFSFTADDIAYP